MRSLLLAALLVLLAMPPQCAQAQTRRLFRNWDRNDDGQVTRDELPRRMWGEWDDLDSNGDGVLTIDEASHGKPVPKRAGAESDQDGFKEISQFLRQAIAETDLEGAALQVIRDGEVVFERGFGNVQPETAMPIASASKWLSAATIMTVVDEGKLSLDDPVKKHLPRFKGQAGEITLRQLLSHTSGLPSKHEILDDRSLTLEEAVNRLADVQLVSEPGSEFRYGGVSLQVAGRMAEIASGKPWAELFQERMADKLDMHQTQYAGGKDGNPRIAGGARSTLREYGNFLEMILNRGEFRGQRVLSQEAVEEIERDQIGEARIGYSPRGEMKNTGYGLGVWISRRDGGDAAVISSPGKFGFTPWIDRERQVQGVYAVLIRDARTKAALGLFPSMPRQVDEALKASVKTETRPAGDAGNSEKEPTGESENRNN